MILQRKRLALDTSSDIKGTTRCTAVLKQGEKRMRGRPCASCGLMSNGNTITSTTTGKLFRTPSDDCKSKNLIYCAQCRVCNKQYTGKTVTRLQNRISGHRTHVGDTEFDESDEAALVQHLVEDHNFDTIDRFNLNFSFTVVELSPHDLDKAEQRWASRLVTMRPFGLNKEKPLGVADSVRTMSRKSLASKNQR